MSVSVVRELEKPCLMTIDQNWESENRVGGLEDEKSCRGTVIGKGACLTALPHLSTSCNYSSASRNKRVVLWSNIRDILGTGISFSFWISVTQIFSNKLLRLPGCPSENICCLFHILKQWKMLWWEPLQLMTDGEYQVFLYLHLFFEGK